MTDDNGLCHGLIMYRTNLAFRCHHCKRPFAPLADVVLVPKGIEMGDSQTSIGEMGSVGCVRQYWCLECGQKLSKPMSFTAADWIIASIIVLLVIVFLFAMIGSFAREPCDLFQVCSR